MISHEDEAGALAPGFLVFIVAVSVGTMFFLQVGHAIVLAREATTAADAAALAGANAVKGHWGQFVSHHAQCAVGKAGDPGHDCGPEPAVDQGAACAGASDYAARNRSTVIDCSVSWTVSTGISVTVEIRGWDGTISGPSSSIPQGRPEKRSRAVVAMPPGLWNAVQKWVDDIEVEIPEPPEPPDDWDEDEDGEWDPPEPDPDVKVPPGLGHLIDQADQSRVRLVPVS